MSARAPSHPRAEHDAALRVRYVDAALDELLADPSVLAVIGFGTRAPEAHDDPRYFNTGLEALGARAPFEVWHGGGAVESGRDGDIQWSSDGALRFGALSLCESACGGPADAADAAYRRLLDFVEASAQPALLRIWNLVDAINEGEGDDERYRQFCLGRARGIQTRLQAYPAATAVGLHDGQRRLRVYWLAARDAGRHIENPRQVAAWRYPREYGPQPPSFSRATLAASPGVPLLLSGTASVVGHATMHADDVAAQTEETIKNLSSLLQTASRIRPGVATAIGATSLLKIYLRNVAEAETIEALLDAGLAASVPRLLVRADICRADLRIEIDGFHG
jgi:chorismate lyase / 3-hydroxybenzoate synthase